MNKEGKYDWPIIIMLIFIFSIAILLSDFTKYYGDIGKANAYFSILYMFTVNSKYRNFLDVFFLCLLAVFFLMLIIIFEYDLSKTIFDYRLLIYIRILMEIFNFLSLKIYHRKISISRGDGVDRKGHLFLDLIYFISCIIVMFLTAKQII